MKKVFFTQRLMAYLVDFLVVYLILALCTGILSALVPTSEKVSNSEKELLEKYEELLKDPDNSNAEKFLDEQKENLYIIGQYSVPQMIIGIIVNIGYFGAFQFMNKGQTLGKKFVKIKVKENNPDKKFTYLKAIIRAGLTYAVISDACYCVIYLVLKPSNFIIPYGLVGIVAFAFKLATIAMIAFRKDGRGLPDFIAGTQVVSAN